MPITSSCVWLFRPIYPWLHPKILANRKLAARIPVPLSEVFRGVAAGPRGRSSGITTSPLWEVHQLDTHVVGRLDESEANTSWRRVGFFEQRSAKRFQVREVSVEVVACDCKML